MKQILLLCAIALVGCKPGNFKIHEAPPEMQEFSYPGGGERTYSYAIENLGDSIAAVDAFVQSKLQENKAYLAPGWRLNFLFHKYEEGKKDYNMPGVTDGSFRPGPNSGLLLMYKWVDGKFVSLTDFRDGEKRLERKW